MGAWIEIWIQPDFFSGSTVAPLVGAWIEIPMHQAHLASGFPSLPLWERGLKFSFLLGVEMSVRVAPLVGAWIEIGFYGRDLPDLKSLPLWERGLKYLYRIQANILIGSLPLWERVLKFMRIWFLLPAMLVAPLVGAWIEIISIKAEIFYSMVAPLVGAWIEIFPYSLHSPEFIVAPLVGAWIEIGLFIPFAHPLPSRSPCGSVD